MLEHCPAWRGIRAARPANGARTLALGPPALFHQERPIDADAEDFDVARADQLHI